MVFTDELKFEISRLDSTVLSVKSISNTNFPKVKGVFISLSFHKDNTLTSTNQIVSYYMATYRMVINSIIIPKSISISKLDISSIPATKEKPGIMRSRMGFLFV